MKKIIGDKVYTYQIGDKAYIQRPLVLGQWRQLLELLQSVIIPADVSPAALIAVLGDKLETVLAIVLTEVGEKPRNKDLAALTDELFEITPETAVRVVSDFFDCNPIPLFLNEIAEMMEKIGKQMKAIGQPKSALSSPEEISPAETGSSGMSP